MSENSTGEGNDEFLFEDDVPGVVANGDPVPKAPTQERQPDYFYRPTGKERLEDLKRKFPQMNDMWSAIDELALVDRELCVRVMCPMRRIADFIILKQAIIMVKVGPKETLPYKLYVQKLLRIDPIRQGFTTECRIIGCKDGHFLTDIDTSTSPELYKIATVIGELFGIFDRDNARLAFPF